MRMRFDRRFSIVAALVLAATLAPITGLAKSWSGGTGDWHTAGNWSPSGVPAAGEAVTASVGNAVILLTNETALLGSFSMTGGRLVFSNWTTRLMATNITISAGTVTVASAFGELGVSNRVWLVCSNNFTLNSTGRIDVSNLGYLPSAGPGKGVPETFSYGGGGGHGGRGGTGFFNGGLVNDSLTEPGAPGSGGSGTNFIGGCGGGVVRIEAGGTATVNGLIAANGQTVTGNIYGGGGAGGTICIAASSFTGSTNGLLQANGGVGGSWRPGNGGGGRIAVIGGTVSNPLLVRFSTASTLPSTAQSGVVPVGSTVNLWADWGTVYIADTNVLSGMPQNNQFTKTVLQAGSATSWTVGQLTLTNNSFRLIPEGFQLNVTGNLTIATNAELGIRGSITCDGDLLLTNNGILSVYSASTNGPADYGSFVNVGGDLRISGFNTWLRPYASPTNGGGVILRMRNLAITQTNAGINASGCGFTFGQGPGAGSPNNTYAGGGGYGGRGCSVSTAGLVNGNPYAPLLPGSGGGIRTAANINESSGYGGGLIRVEASNSVTLNGRLIAQGGAGYASQYGSGGAGGGIFIACSNFEGTADAALDAKGGNSGRPGDVGGGGGGRIAVWHGSIRPQRRAQLLAGSATGALMTDALDAYQGSINVSTGIGYLAVGVPAENGTAWFITFPTTAPPVAVITSHTNGMIIQTNSFAIGAEAFSDGYVVTQVYFYADGVLLGADPTEPYAWNWTAAPLGSHTLMAAAYDSMGQCTTSASVRVKVVNSVKTWALTGAGDWFDNDNWEPAGFPGEGDLASLSLPGATVILTNETAALAFFQMGAGSLVFSNWNTKLSALEVVVSGGTVTVANAFADLEMSNRVWVACSNDFTLASPGRIDVSYLGYTNFSGPGRGVPESASYCGGGGHGGKGGVGYFNGGPAYDSLMDPGAPGSGGGGTNQGGCGGGVVRIEAGGAAILNGPILANGQAAPMQYGGGGAGGTIWVSAGSFTGNTNGLLQANGGIAGHSSYGGGGGGGRIALIGGPVSMPLQVRFSTAPGMPSTSQSGVLPYGSTMNTWADWGTVYIADSNLFAGMPQNNQFTKTILQAGAATNWSVSRLELTNNSFRLSPDGFQLSVAGDLTVGTNAELGIRGSIDCGGHLVITNNGLLTVYSGPTNGALSYGALVNVASNLLITGDSAWLRPHADPVNGGGVLLRMANLAITQTNAGINAAGRGFGPGQGPGKGGGSGQYSAGGGHGGSGAKGTSTAIVGVTNGNPYAPGWPGSGGGVRTNWSDSGAGTNLTDGTGFGGGLIRVEATNSVMLEGQLVAQGGRGRGASTYGAGGAGGAIWIWCRTFTGSVDAVLDASGGSSGLANAGGGGGGRIAVWYGGKMPDETPLALQAGTIPRRVTVDSQSEAFAGTISVTNGLNSASTNNATVGTVVFIKYIPPPTGTLMILH